MSRARLVTRIATVAAAAALTAAPALATGPLITDASGDQSDISCWVLITACPVLYNVAAEPAIDILEGDIASTATELVLTVQVDDLDTGGVDPTFGRDEDATFHYFAFSANGASVDVHSERTFDKTKQTAYMNVSGLQPPVIGVPPAVVYDDTADTVSFTISLADLNQALAIACPTCAPVTSGTTLTGIRIGASFGPYVHADPVGMILYSGVSSDNASTADSYTVGA